ncbi:hypothetical protein MA5S0921_0104 [Mycobacteroides abscessus 5S-0921]|nr:hypothetical protein MA5S0421_4837 [Mycobacteroides abscessus 5S-0421]EIU10903.1 hypothetical protein MA5S0304_4603 [Mycobacteroides abscessus 5S-0304]EIU21318.1 hypothetical protein MA5S0708_4529 [Mycobacteroides abscessus 5S-0708]EIU25267.1 hypothetical protein MA5S0817_4152 [Mycobacteroides abscessus 5S-0817]EIU44945.1 hypothetical protein MA5S1215_4556 [Mycobacteroides abscessus 5S-1215]EIV01784.1 hypothetical protein MA5S0921_0104 [Mycobacteroides abscessus 5S-0921]
MLLRYWRVVLAAVCAVFVVVAATVVAAEFGWPGNETHAQLPPTRQLADLSDTQLAGFLPNAADLPMGWRAQQDAAHPGLSEISGTASQPGCSQRPDQVAVSTAAVSATLRGPLLEADTFPAEVTIALLRDPESVNLHVRTQSWVAQCAQVTMHYRGTGICQADLNTKVLPNLSVGTVVVGRFKIVSTNKHCLHGDSYSELDSIAGITMARVSGLTVVIHSDGLSDLAEPIVRMTLQRLAAFPAAPSLPRNALASNGPAFLALLPTLAQTPPNGRWFVDQRSGEQQRNLAPAQPITTSPTGCEPLPFPDTDLMIEGPKAIHPIGGIHVLRYGTGPAGSELGGDAQASFYRDTPGVDMLAATRTWARRCQQYQITNGHPCHSVPTVYIQALPANQYRADDAIQVIRRTENWCSSTTDRTHTITVLQVRGVIIVAKSSAPDDDGSTVDWLIRTAVNNVRQA